MDRPLLAAAAAVVALAAPCLAHADAIDDPCQENQLGAPCTNRDGEDGFCVEGELDDFVCSTYDPCADVAAGAACTKPGTNQAGTCQDDGDGGLACTPGGGTGGATTTATGGDAGAGGGGDGATTGSGTGGGSSGGATEDDGCAVKAPGKKSATRAGAATVFLAGLALTVLRAARRAPRGAGRS